MIVRISFFIFVVTLLLYGSVATHDFINFDTHRYLLLNPYIQEGLNAESITWAFTTFYFANWHPITWLSYLVEIEIFGFLPGPFHLTNVFLHAANAVLLLLFLYAATAKLWPSTLVALLFAIHPAQVESVAWVAERKDVLCLFFMLCCLLAYDRFVKTGEKLSYCAAFLAFVLGLMSKPMILTLPFVLLLFDFWPYRRVTRDRWLWLIVEKLPFFFATAVSGSLTLIAQVRGGAVVDGSTLDLSERLVTALVAYGYYLKTAFFPAELAVFYPHPGSWPLWIINLSAVCLSLATLAAMVLARKLPWFVVGWLFFLGTLVPVIGFVQVGAQAYADRYSYIPYIGLFISVAWLVTLTVEKLPAYAVYLKTTVGLLCLVYALTTLQYLSHWKNSVTLWSHTLYVTDSRYRVAAGTLGQMPEDDRPAGLFKGYYSLGILRLEAAQYHEAEWLLREAVALLPASLTARFYHGVALNALGRRAAAEEQFDLIMKLQPDNEQIRREIARELDHAGT